MKIKSKYVEYINILLNEDYVNISDLEKIIKKSTKTIIKELDELESILKSNDITLVRKQGKGIWIECEENKKFELQEELTKHQSTRTRLDYDLFCILMEIAFTKTNVTELSKKLYMSPPTITKKIQKINSYLKEYNLAIVVQDKELKIDGREVNIRKHLFEILKSEVYVNDLVAYLNSSNPDLVSKSPLIINDNLRIVNEKQSRLEDELNIKLTDQSVLDIYLHFTISSLRIKRLETINNYERIRTNYNNIKHLEEFVQLYKVLGYECYELIFDINETKYLSYIIANYLSTINNNINYENEDNKLYTTIMEGLQNANYLVNYDMRLDTELLEGLENHLEPALNRFANQIPINSPFTYQIKNDYELAFNIAKIIVVTLQKKYSVTENVDDEIALIALHVQASIERFAFEETPAIKVAIVSSSGQGSPQLIKSKLLKQFKNVQSADILSVFEYYSVNLDKYDLIVSTTYLNQFKVPIINVTPLISYKDLNKISNFLIQGDLNRIKKFNISELCVEDLCFYTSCETKEELITLTCQQLQELDYIDENYQKSILNRELVASTDNKMFAVPHGNPSYVNKTAIAVIVNNKPIDWGKHQIQLVIVPLISNQEKYNAESLMTSIFSLKNKPAVLEEIKKSNSKDELYKKIRSINDQI